MIPDEMIDYAIGGLDDGPREQVEREAAGDPELADDLQRVLRSIDLLLEDGEDPEPPPDLARRTVAFVASHRARRHILEFAPISVPFRWADVAVAAGIFVAGLATLLPAVRRSQLQADQVLCSFNLGQLGRGMANYAMTHGTYPYPARDCPAPFAALYKVLLNDAGELDDPSLLDCPSNGHRSKPPLPDYKTFCSLSKSDPKAFTELLDGDYAYHIGYQHPSGRPTPASLSSPRVPLLSDRPPCDGEGHVLAGNSPNHQGGGQNVLFSDGHVGWHPTRAIGPRDRDMFLNARHRAEPGVNPDDNVLAPGEIPFFDAR